MSMELLIIGGLLAVIAFFSNIRLVAVCILLAIGGGWLYQQLPTSKKEKIQSYYNDVTGRGKRAWNVFWD